MMKHITIIKSCIAAAILMITTIVNAQWTLTGSGAAGTVATPGHASIVGNLAVGGNLNMSAASTIQSPTQLLLASGTSYLNITPAAVGLVVNAGLGTLTVNGNQTIIHNQAVGGNLSVTGDITMGATSTIVSPTRLYLAGGLSRIDLNTSGTTAVVTNTSSTGNGIYSFVTGTGYVKIGAVTTPNPAGYKLYVDQGILTEKVKVAVAGSANWSDYVFAKDYKLMPLDEVEQFVKANNHLPNVLSADEMVKEGNDLGKTDAKLLEKIEELTLYMIEIKKENQQLKLMIAEQDKKIELLKNN